MDIADYLKEKGLSQAKFAELVSTPERKVTQGLVWQWMNGRTQVSIEAAAQVEKHTGGAIRCEELRPDVDWAYLRRPAKPAEQAA